MQKMIIICMFSEDIVLFSEEIRGYRKGGLGTNGLIQFSIFGLPEIIGKPKNVFSRFPQFLVSKKRNIALK